MPDAEQPSANNQAITFVKDSSSPKIIGTDSPRNLWGLYEITISPDGELDWLPIREAEAHYNIKGLLTAPKCTNCLKLTLIEFKPGEAWIKFEVGLANPTKIVGYDVRGIIIDKSGYYLGDPDALTPYVGSVVYDKPNGFHAYATDQPDCAFPKGGFDPPQYLYRDFELHYPPPYSLQKLLKIVYAVDVSFPTPCDDPWFIGDLTPESTIYKNSPAVTLSLDVKDHQSDLSEVSLIPALGWIGDIPVFAPVSGTDTWQAAFTNCGIYDPGTYDFRVKAVSPNASGSKDLYLYKDVQLVIEDYECTADLKNYPEGAEKLELVGTRWDSVCMFNLQDYYFIDFNDPAMQNPGVLSGRILLRNCLPDTRLKIVYYDPDSETYFDGYSVKADQNGNAQLKIHMPNSVITGDVAETCYIKVELPASSNSDTPYRLESELAYKLTSCGDPVSVSTIGAPDIPIASGMVQGVLCDPDQMDWYRLDTSDGSVPLGHIIGMLNFQIEYPDPIPPSALTGVSLRDEDGTLLANFYITVPPQSSGINLGELDLPSMYIYYLCINSPTQSATPRFYKITWAAQVDTSCTEDSINLTNPDPPYINPVKTNWNDFVSPGSSARMWLCSPDDTLDAYPLTLPETYPSSGILLDGNLRVQSDGYGYPFINVSLGLEQTVGNGFSWYAPITLANIDNTYDVSDYWQIPTNIEGYPLRYWLKVENAGDGAATAQVECDFSTSNDCSTDADSDTQPSGTVMPNGSITSYLSPGNDTEDYWEVDWDGIGRLKGIVGAVCDKNIRLELWSHGHMFGSSEGKTPSLSVNNYDFGPDCFGPILKLIPIGGSTGDCVQYFVSGALLTETQTCESDPDSNDTYEEIQDKPWMWFSPMGTSDEICGVVCNDGGIKDIDVMGISSQPFDTQGILYGFIMVNSPTPDGHKLSLISVDGQMVISSDNLTPPLNMALIDLGPYNLPAIPPKGYTYHVVLGPDPTGADSISQYNCIMSMGINSEFECADDGHDFQNEAWDIPIQSARLGLLCGFGDAYGIDAGLPDLVDWFRLDYNQDGMEFLSGTITLESETDGLTVRLMIDSQSAGTGTSFYTAVIPETEDSVTITIPDHELPSIPDFGSDYYIVVHNAGIGGKSSYALKVNLVSQ
ncbi:MAG: hypothetical protein ABIC40_06250 [bacterium]